MDKSLMKGLAVLEALAASRAPRGVSDLARALGMTKSNVHRVLQTLVAGGYARHDPLAGVYAPSLKLWKLGTGIVDGLDVREIASPILSGLTERTGEGTYLSVLENGRDVVITRIDSRHVVREHGRIGFSAPAHCTATGKAMLAHLTGVADLPDHLEAVTPRTITSRAALHDELLRVSQEGFAISQGEWAVEVSAIGAPVIGAAGQVLAAVGLSGPAERLRARALRQHAPELIAAARMISVGLAGVAGR